MLLTSIPDTVRATSAVCGNHTDYGEGGPRERNMDLLYLSSNYIANSDPQDQIV